MDRPQLSGRLGQVTWDGELPARDAVPLVFDELDHLLAVQAYLWALPIVSYAQWCRVHYDTFGATASDLVLYDTYADRLGIITANATTPYILNFFDLSQTGPLVLDLPAGPTAGGISDFWQREIAVTGEMGPDRGEGGRYLVVPPGVPTPEGAEELREVTSSGVNIMVGLRALDPDPVVARALVDAVRIYPFAERHDPPPTRVVTPGGKSWSGVQPRGEEYWERLHEVLQSEVVDERDRFFVAMLRQLGIERGAPFAPDERLRRVLVEGAAAGELLAQTNAFAKRFDGARVWPDRQWDKVATLASSSQRAGDHDQLLERASWFYEAVTFSQAMDSQVPGLGQAYLGAYTDADGAWLDGGRTYRLRVPADVPAKNFWSVTVYDVATRCLVDNPSQRGDRGSRDADLVVDPDGSVELVVGPDAPESGTSNWIETVPGRHWFSYLRLYGPLEGYFDRSWKLSDFDREPA